MSAPTRKDYLGWAATAFALVVTFSAEYELAKAVGIHHMVALAVPGALDVYVLRALQVRKDVFLTVLAMILVNAASHLVTAGVLAVQWPLIVAVSAIAPLVLWRSHVLGGFTGTQEWRTWRKAKVHDVPEHVIEDYGQVFPACSWCGSTAVAEYLMDVHKESTCPKRFEYKTFDEHADEAQDVVFPGTVNVPRNVLQAPDQDEWPEYDWPFSSATPQKRVLHLVPPVENGVLLDGDKEFLDQARELGTPTIRALKALGMGTDRARRLKAYLDTENTEEQS